MNLKDKENKDLFVLLNDVPSYYCIFVFFCFERFLSFDITKLNTVDEIESFKGPKFVSDEEIERIKAKIEEDNRAIAALDIKKYGE